MSPLLTRTCTALRRFSRSDDGTLSVEAVLILPALCMLYVASFVWFDAYRTQNINLTGTYTIADLISRETDGVTEDLFDGLDGLYEYITYSEHPTQLRISVIECTADCEDENTRQLEVCWSRATDGRDALTTQDLANRHNEVPIFPFGDELIVAETFMAYTPAFNVGLEGQVFETTVFTSPRMPGQLKFMAASGDQHCFNN